MDIFAVFSLIGGLALFLYGMDFMGDGLKKLSGGQLESILGKLTSTRIKGFLLGLMVTAVIQSSSATTVMLVGFVNSGIMKLSQTISIIMGANVGTTVTSWIISLTGLSGDSFIVNIFKPSSFTPILAFVGFLLSAMSKKDSRKNVGLILLGFAILMYGMEAMSSSMDGLKDSEQFKQILVMFENPILGILSGTLLTAIIQSSSASIGILQALSMTGVIPFATALPIILGQNIGTTITPVLSALSANKNAKRVAISCVYIKFIGVIFFCVIFYILHGILDFGFMHQNANVVSIAVFHTAFNIVSSVVLIPFCKWFELLAIKTFPDASEQTPDELATLDDRFLDLPQFAIDNVRSLVCEMMQKSKIALSAGLDIVSSFDKSKQEEIREIESRVDMMEDKIGTYLVKLASRDLSEKEGRDVSKLLHIIGDIERISDHAVNLLEVAEEINAKKIAFTPEATKEISVMSEAINEIIAITCEALESGNVEDAKKIEPLEQVVDKLRFKLKQNHIQRLQGNNCTIEIGFVFSDFITNCERVADHCSNIGVCLVQLSEDQPDAHEYLKNLKESHNPDFEDMYLHYKQKYSL